MREDDLLSKANGIVIRMCEEIERLGFSQGKQPLYPDLAAAEFFSTRDPYSGEMTSESKWLGNDGSCAGEIKIHGDGSFYGEYDVLRPHPRNPEWFVECVVVWGKGELIKSEPRLIRSLDE